jgi:hypothetical protein
VRAELIDLHADWCKVQVVASIESREMASATVFLGLLAHQGPDADLRTTRWKDFLADTFPECFGVNSEAERVL